MADMIPQGTQENGVPSGHEVADANIRAVFISVVVILSSVLVTMLAMAGMFNFLNNRERAKDAKTPATFFVRQLAPKPYLLPSPQQDELPWQAYQNERRVQESTAANYKIIDSDTGYYKVPGSDVTGQEAINETASYFQTKPKWDLPTRSFKVDNGYTPDTTGGHGQAAANARFGTTGTSAPRAVRPGSEREIGPEQIKSEPTAH